ncbi:MAG TPA: SRPBCC family protein [Actinomycetota bacterium]|nr:SRPBCC family protein [Actinomycetota bacterium]
MAAIDFVIRTTTSPDTVFAALTDFTSRRPALWPALDPDVYHVEMLGETRALVREGQRSPRLWALEEYDWSTPGTVTWTARESNFCAPGSLMSATISPESGGGSAVAFRWSRRGIGVKGHLIVAMVRATKGRPLVAGLSKALDGLAAKEQQAR